MAINETRFEECMKDLHYDMVSWANEIYDDEGLCTLDDCELRRIEDAIWKCAKLVEDYAKFYGIEVH